MQKTPRDLRKSPETSSKTGRESDTRFAHVSAHEGPTCGNRASNGIVVHGHSHPKKKRGLGISVTNRAANLYADRDRELTDGMSGRPERRGNGLFSNRRLARARRRLPSAYVGLAQFRSESQRGRFVVTGDGLYTVFGTAQV